MPLPTATAARLRIAGLSEAALAAAGARYDAGDVWEKGATRRLIASRSDEVLRHTYGDGAAPSAGLDSAALAAAHDTDAEREGFIPARLSDIALRAAFARREPFRAGSLFRGAGIVATRSGNLGAATPLSNGTDTSMVTRIKHKAVTDLADVRLVYANITNGAAGPNPITVGASVELPGAVLIPVTFGGRKTAIIDPGGYVVSDPLPQPPGVVAGTIFHSRTYVAAAAGEKWPTNVTTSNSGEGRTVNAAVGLLTSGTVADSFTFGYAPTCVIGATTSPVRSLAIIGDSLGAGQADAPTPAQGCDAGFLQRAAYAANIGYVALAKPGERNNQFVVPANFALRFVPVAGCTHAVVQYGINDVNNGAALADMQASALALWTAVAGRGVVCFQTTITPSSTAANTVPAANEATRVGFNDWLRAGAPIHATTKAAVAVGTAGALLAGQTGHPLTGYFEVADVAETARNSGLWKATYSADGTHPEPVGYTAMAAAIDTSRFAA